MKYFKAITEALVILVIMVLCTPMGWVGMIVFGIMYSLISRP